ncbi:MAG: LD-carboxypeptidase [Sphingomonas sanxanigenens]|uniref:LD-carboxypeptidase n=1 Tax=Sphingomonas sanxanigenens TaxID=397260 RepID=A0A2W5A1P7_9SPHN|nr:MAG: LD-carboxypeptidase [Sphingomonas sanxanigenens]
MRIGIVAPAGRIEPALAERLLALVGGRAELAIHPQCFRTHGHFAGSDEERAAALIAYANDPAIDAIWFARGGYGSARIVERVLPALGPAARAKQWLGYSDMGTLLGAFYGAGFRHVAHGPMPGDLKREGGEGAVLRAIDWLVDRDPAALEPSPGRRAAFNITILAHLIGTPWQPDLSGHVLMLEEVSEYHYAIDRAFAQITANANIRRVAGIRLGRCSLIPRNDVDFGMDEVAIAEHWCRVSGIPFLGRADIGHDADNRIVPFG